MTHARHMYMYKYMPPLHVHTCTVYLLMADVSLLCMTASGSKRTVSGIFVGLVSKHDVPFPIEGKLNIQQYLRKNIEK